MWSDSPIIIINVAIIVYLSIDVSWVVEYPLESHSISNLCLLR